MKLHPSAAHVLIDPFISQIYFMISVFVGKDVVALSYILSIAIFKFSKLKFYYRLNQK